MKIIRARGVNQALPMGVDYLLHSGLREDTRVGPALVSPVPVVTVYSEPRERVLFSAVRDANPFFHLAESLWMLLGRGDAAFLNRFISNFGERFAEEDGMVHGAYGRRWRNHFIDESKLVHDAGYNDEPCMDQLDIIIKELRSNPSSRQVVLTMWDPEVDLGVIGLKDRPCNTQVYFRIRDTAYRSPPVTDQNSAEHEARITDGRNLVLDMTVCCRSNDIIMGAYGANAVHFSVLQEYVSAMVGCEVGFYYQVSNNYHAYERDLERLADRANEMGVISMVSFNQYLGDRGYETLATERLVDDPATFNAEMVEVVSLYEAGSDNLHERRSVFNNRFLSDTVWPMLMVHQHWRFNPDISLRWSNLILAQDWRRAAVEWVGRRITKKEDARAEDTRDVKTSTL